MQQNYSKNGSGGGNKTLVLWPPPPNFWMQPLKKCTCWEKLLGSSQENIGSLTAM